MTNLKFRFSFLIVAALAAAAIAEPAAAAFEETKEESDHPRSPARKELLRLIDQLEVKLPRDLARKLIVISMKLSTGYCSPYEAKEFEEAVGSLPQSEIRIFEKEWKGVREHKHWPRMPKSDGDRRQRRDPS